MKAGPNRNRGGDLCPAATIEGNLALLARTDALRRRREHAAAVSIEHATVRAVPLNAILPFAILGGNALMHDYLSRGRIARLFTCGNRDADDGNDAAASMSFPHGEG
jgi:hypothetical protein